MKVDIHAIRSVSSSLLKSRILLVCSETNVKVSVLQPIDVACITQISKDSVSNLQCRFNAYIIINMFNISLDKLLVMVCGAFVMLSMVFFTIFIRN